MNGEGRTDIDPTLEAPAASQSAAKVIMSRFQRLVQPASEPLLSHLYLVRHGETEWSLSGRHTGRIDIGLTERGDDEARALAPSLASIKFEHVLTSPALRARRTCELSGLGTSAQTEPDLQEWDYGSYEGRCSSEIREDRPGWILCRDGCPGGEDAADVAARADRLIRRLRTLDGNIALFSHGQFGSSLAARWIGLEIVESQHFSLGTASLGVLGYNPVHPEVSVIARWNIAPGYMHLIS